MFARLDNLVLRLKNIFAELDAGDLASKEKLEHMASEIQQLCQYETDACIAVLHLPNEYRYSLFHSIRCAMICCLIMQDEDIGEHEQKMIIAAALTANVGMHELQDTLAKQQDKLSVEQRTAVDTHPEKSIKLLKAVGVTDRVWLMTILDHHERGDGSGYPRQLSLADISRGGLILAVADRYGAMISIRDYREPVFIKDALSLFLLDKGKAYDTRYALLLIKQLSIFPPGTFVKLNNGEIAIVIKRGVVNPMKPIVKSFLGPDNTRYINPLFRECGLNGYEVEALSAYDPKIPLNYSHLWDYT